MKPVRTAPRDRKDAREMMVRWVPPVPREPMERLGQPGLMEQLGPTESLVQLEQPGPMERLVPLERPEPPVPPVQLVLLVRERSFHLRQGFRFH